MNTELTVIRITSMPCPECGEQIEDGELGGPLYECSRCSGTEVVEEGERGRCSDCNIFMAKMFPYTCPHCESGIEEDQLDFADRTLYETEDGQRHETIAAAEAWIADEPERIRRHEEHVAKMAEWEADYAREKAARMERLHAAVDGARDAGFTLAYYEGPHMSVWESQSTNLTPEEWWNLLGIPNPDDQHEDGYVKAIALYDELGIDRIYLHYKGSMMRRYPHPDLPGKFVEDERDLEGDYHYSSPYGCSSFSVDTEKVIIPLLNHWIRTHTPEVTS